MEVHWLTDYVPDVSPRAVYSSMLNLYRTLSMTTTSFIHRLFKGGP